MGDTADVVVIGAGIAGLATAYQLAVVHGVGGLMIVDPRPPLTLTSDKSTESYRNWWPDAPMVGLMNRSIDILNDLSGLSGDRFALTRRGYLFVTADRSVLGRMSEQAHRTSELGGGAVRTHPGPTPYGDWPDGADILSQGLLREHFPYVSRDAIGAVHVRRAGWFDAQQLGVWMLEQARNAGALLVRAEVSGIGVDDGSVSEVVLDGGGTIQTRKVVDAAGPMAGPVAAMAGVVLPLFSELHLKVMFRDHLRAVARGAPMLIWSDPQRIEWSDRERAGLEQSGRRELLDELPSFCHGRPEGGPDSPYVVGLWEYDRKVTEPRWPISIDELYPEVVIRGLARMLPGLDVYREGLPETSVDGGYYTKTRENRPLIGPCGPDGFHVVAGLSGFGVMIAAGAADLVADHIVGTTPASYADSFLLSRYDDAGYVAGLEATDSGQL